MAQSYGSQQLHSMSEKGMQFEDPDIAALLGELEFPFVTTITGYSGQGKTELDMHLAKALVPHYPVRFWSFENRLSGPYRRASRRNEMDKLRGYIPINPFNKLDGRTLFDDMCYQLDKRGKYINIVDSIDSSRFTYDEVLYLIEHFVLDKKKHAFMFNLRTSHSGRPLKNKYKDVPFDGDMIIHVKDFIADPVKNRFEGQVSKPYVIYEPKARERNPAFFKKRDQETNGQ